MSPEGGALSELFGVEEVVRKTLELLFVFILKMSSFNFYFVYVL